MCGRVFVKTTIDGLIHSFAFAHRGEAEALGNTFPRYNGAPSQDYPIIVREPELATPVFMRARWGFIPRWMKEANGGPKPINAKSETVGTNGMYKHAYRSRRALMPIDGFFEWKAILGEKAKQPFAIAMKSGEPFALAAIWGAWRDPALGGEERRTFCVLTCVPNEMMATIHNRMPVILHPADYTRWLSDIEEDPHDLLKPFPSELMTMWQISSKVGSPKNDTPDILDPLGT